MSAIDWFMAMVLFLVVAAVAVFIWDARNVDRF
jgi:hypothetical protein